MSLSLPKPVHRSLDHRQPALTERYVDIHSCRANNSSRLCSMEVGAMHLAIAPVYIYVALLSVVLITSDLRHRTLPNAWTLSAYPILIVLLMIPTAYAGDWGQLGRAILGALVTVLTFYLLAVLSKDGMGMGDVKLAGALALVLAWQSWMSLLLAMAGAFMLSAVFGLILLALRRASRRSELPFGPFLIAATWLVIILN